MVLHSGVGSSSHIQELVIKPLNLLVMVVVGLSDVSMNFNVRASFLWLDVGWVGGWGKAEEVRLGQGWPKVRLAKSGDHSTGRIVSAQAFSGKPPVLLLEP